MFGLTYDARWSADGVTLQIPAAQRADYLGMAICFAAVFLTVMAAAPRERVFSTVVDAGCVIYTVKTAYYGLEPSFPAAPIAYIFGASVLCGGFLAFRARHRSRDLCLSLSSRGLAIDGAHFPRQALFDCRVVSQRIVIRRHRGRVWRSRRLAPVHPEVESLLASMSTSEQEHRDWSETENRLITIFSRFSNARRR